MPARGGATAATAACSLQLQLQLEAARELRCIGRQPRNLLLHCVEPCLLCRVLHLDNQPLHAGCTFLLLHIRQRGLQDQRAVGQQGPTGQRLADQLPRLLRLAAWVQERGADAGAARRACAGVLAQHGEHLIHIAKAHVQLAQRIAASSVRVALCAARVWPRGCVVCRPC